MMLKKWPKLWDDGLKNLMMLKWNFRDEGEDFYSSNTDINVSLKFLKDSGYMGHLF